MVVMIVCSGFMQQRRNLNNILKGNTYYTSSPKGNDAHMRATIQSEKKWKDQIFRRLRAKVSKFIQNS